MFKDKETALMAKQSSKDKAINAHKNIINQHELYYDGVSQRVPCCSKDKMQQ